MGLQNGDPRRIGQMIRASLPPQEQAGGWTYRTFQWRESDGDAKVWRQNLADDGWEETGAGAGAWSTVDGHRTFVVALRRRSDRPWATPPR